MPEEGSSRRTASTPPTRAMPRASFRLLPPEYWPLRLAAISFGIATLAKTSSTSSRTNSASTPCHPHPPPLPHSKTDGGQEASAIHGSRQSRFPTPACALAGRPLGRDKADVGHRCKSRTSMAQHIKASLRNLQFTSF